MGLFDRFDSAKFKVHLKTAIARMQLQRNKKANLVKIQKREIAGLLDKGKDESARIKVEHIIREDFYMEALEILELFCELLQARIPQIDSHDELPVELSEAINTLLYASYRVDIKELASVREDLHAKYGKQIQKNALENADGSVNPRVINKLATSPPEQFLVLQYLREIAQEYKIDWQGGDWQADLTMSLPAAPVGGAWEVPGAPGGGYPGGRGGGGGMPYPAPLDPRLQMLQHPPYVAPAPAAPLPTPLAKTEYSGVPNVAAPSPLDEYGQYPQQPQLQQQQQQQQHHSSSSPHLSQHTPPPPPFSEVPGPTVAIDSLPAAPVAHDLPSGGDSGLPDFDELTRRFEALKRR